MKLLCYGAIIAACFINESSFAAPRFSIHPKAFDFLSVSEGTVVEKTFTISNKGSDPLVIQKVAPACGCTVSTLASSQIAPGESTTLQLKLNTRGFNGGVQKKVFIFTNDPEQLTVTVPVVGKIKPDIEVEPTFLDLGDVLSKDGSSPRRVKVRAVNGEGASKVSSGKYLEASLAERGEVIVRVRPEAPLGELHDRLVVHAEGIKAPVIVPIVARVHGSIWTDPSVVSFGVVKHGATISRNISLLGDAADAKIEALHKALSVTAKRVSGVPTITITLQTSHITKEEFQGQIKITSKTGDEILVTVLAVVTQER